ncbi:hypothetical protein J3R83DRAFT_3367 [Lanmaoa asiatica]|nr:hypothetical protein J3R83DRAFT_3367 [Lanmaoa asiatica]
MSVCLVEDRAAEQGVADNMESAFWMLLWAAPMYSQSSTSDKRHNNFIKNTFKINKGSEGKRSVFSAQTIFDPPLFPDREALNKLLKELVDLFKYYYDKVKDTDETILAAADHALRFLTTHPAFRHAEAHACLKTHDYIIKVFNNHLEMDWSTDDTAQEQVFQTVVTMKLKHMLEEPIDEQESQQHKRPKVVFLKATSDNILRRHFSLSDETLSYKELDEEEE